MSPICQEVRDDYTEPSVEVVAPLTEWGKGPKSIESYQGMISVADVAEWYTSTDLDCSTETFATRWGAP